jgi:hypothetical protein
MHPQMITKQIIDVNKAIFDSTFDTIIALQDHSEKMLGFLLESVSLFPDEGKKVITQWMEAGKKGKEDLRESVGDIFNPIEYLFMNSANVMGYSIYTLIEKTDQSFKEIINKLNKASIEIVDKSAQTIGIIEDKRMKQAVIEKQQAVDKGKSGNGSTITLRRAAKTVKNKK